MFETPSVLRESLPSYSAKPGAFYAPRALRWTTPPRGRTDPFQGSKIKPMFHRCSMFFQDDFGVENGSQNEVKIVLTSSQEPSLTLLEPVCRAMRFAEVLGSLLRLPGTLEIVLPPRRGATFYKNCFTRSGAQNRFQNDPHNEFKLGPKWTPGGPRRAKSVVQSGARF